ncbi:nuclear transport factor 2 family protein [Conexibacter sp. JD483]|uniref:nuclear transport factor 2 family protein n=1 Tax=unclassified Conexibacter TaxID=2627773 RepID=UPI00271CE074|nr:MULTISPECIES: nuclear transport factor 2 family protein [unclassified Conexibacter]MDO8186329.1 nuclear transport factor 2 family protein [Conexibacter sp. CPCC 205706]MDO8197534.1 nuclear transport factor 2 family protein [Conexibacter sp. CPCC 205762]MDR9369644.1 nuclear transport factor 2 family protein [Conexibacter sp. JD483]
MAEPERVFREQVRAFNAADLEAFLATYASETELHGLVPDRVVRGHEQMRPLYEERFTQTPLHCEILALTVYGDRWVAAHEQVTSPAGTVVLVGVFEVVEGLIVRADMTGRVPL